MGAFPYPLTLFYRIRSKSSHDHTFYGLIYATFPLIYAVTSTCELTVCLYGFPNKQRRVNLCFVHASFFKHRHIFPRKDYQVKNNDFIEISEKIFIIFDHINTEFPGPSYGTGWSRCCQRRPCQLTRKFKTSTTCDRDHQNRCDFTIQQKTGEYR